VQEVECIFTLIDRGVLDANLEKALRHVDDCNVGVGLADRSADLKHVVKALVHLVHDLAVLLVLSQQLHKELKLVLVDLNGLQLVRENICALFLPVSYACGCRVPILYLL